MHHEIVLVQLAEIDLSAVALGVVQTASRMRREAAEQFGGRQNDEVRVRKTKTARERAQDEIDIPQCVRANQFAETLNLAFGLKINDDPCVIFAPFI